MDLKPRNQSSNLDGRRRNENGEIDRKHGNTLIGTLRLTYGENFAADRRANMKLGTSSTWRCRNALDRNRSPYNSARNVSRSVFCMI